MTEPPPSVTRAPPKRVLLVAVFVLGLAGWILLRSFTSDAARECRSLYRSARTAADTARIDTTLVAGSLAQEDPRTCGFIRISARWMGTRAVILR